MLAFYIPISKCLWVPVVEKMLRKLLLTNEAVCLCAYTWKWVQMAIYAYDKIRAISSLKGLQSLVVLVNFEQLVSNMLERM